MRKRTVLIIAAALFSLTAIVLVVYLAMPFGGPYARQTLTYEEFLHWVEDGEVAGVLFMKEEQVLRGVRVNSHIDVDDLPDEYDFDVKSVDEAQLWNDLRNVMLAESQDGSGWTQYGFVLETS